MAPALFEGAQRGRFFPAKPLRDDLPLTYSGKVDGFDHLAGIRKRISSLTATSIQPVSSAAAEWALGKSKYTAALGSSPMVLKRWWDTGLGWILSRKPGFAVDLEMNEEEVAAMGRSKQGSLLHIIYKLRSAVRRLIAGQGTLPTSTTGKKSGYQRL